MTDAEPTLYLFDGYNLLHAGAFADPRALRDALAGFLATRGARGVLVFDGGGTDETIGPLEVRHAASADALLERLAAEHRQRETVCLVSSDSVVRGTAGVAVTKRRSALFLAELEQAAHAEHAPTTVADAVDPAVRERLERLRRGG